MARKLNNYVGSEAENFYVLSATRCMQLGDRRRVELKHFADGPDSLDRNREANTMWSD